MANEKKPTKPPKDDPPHTESGSHWEVWGENTYIPWYNRFQVSGSNPEDPPPNPPGTEG